MLSAICFVLLVVVPIREPTTYPTPSPPPINTTNLSSTTAPELTSSTPSGAPAGGTTVLPPRHSWGLSNIRFDSTFLWLVLVRTLAFTFLNPVFNLTDAMVYAMFARVLRAQSGEREVARGHRNRAESGSGSGPPSPSFASGDGIGSRTLVHTPFSAERPSLTELERVPPWVAEEPADPGARIASGYGLARGVGALGWLGISAIAAIVQASLGSPEINETFPYMLMTLIVTHAAAATNFIFFSPGKIRKQTNYLRHVGILLRNKEIIKTYVMATLQGMLHAQFETYIYWYGIELN